VVRGELFDTQIVRADARGVSELQFRFHRRLDSPEHRFYLCDSRFGGVRVRFIDGSAVMEWNERREFAGFRDDRDMLPWIRGIASQVIQSDLYLTGPPFPDPR
jgi:hypothetical protein